jgi:acyl-CoA thioesterase-1
MYSMHRFAAALLLAIFSAACDRDQLSPTSPDQLTPVIVALGDSLTSGPGLTPGQTYPALLEQRLSAAGYRYRVINAGVSGDTTSEALPRFNDAIVPETRIMILALGINDGLRGVPVATVERNLATMIERAKARNISVLLCGMEAPPLGGFGYSVDFHRMYTRLSERYDLPLVPFFLLRVAGNPDLNLDDQFHPNAAGHRVIAESIWPHLRPMLISPATGGSL